MLCHGFAIEVVTLSFRFPWPDTNVPNVVMTILTIVGILWMLYHVYLSFSEKLQSFGRAVSAFDWRAVKLLLPSKQ
jgi:hypothetical protein